MAWNRESNCQSKTMRRQTDIYVFALLSHNDQSSLNPLNLSQWEFYVVPTRLQDKRTRSQHSIALSSLRKIAGQSFKFSEIASAVEEAEIIQKKSG